MSAEEEPGPVSQEAWGRGGCGGGPAGFRSLHSGSTLRGTCVLDRQLSGIFQWGNPKRVTSRLARDCPGPGSPRPTLCWVNSLPELYPRSPLEPFSPGVPGAPVFPGGPIFPGGPCRPLSPCPVVRGKKSDPGAVAHSLFPEVQSNLH